MKKEIMKLNFITMSWVLISSQIVGLLYKYE